MKNQQKEIYGIDFGTSNSAAAFINKNGSSEVIPLDKKAKNPMVIRSIIYISKSCKFSFGQEAVDSYNLDVQKSDAAEKKIIRTGRNIKVTSDASATTGYKPDKIVEQIFESEVTNTGRLLQGIKSLLGNKSLSEINIFGQDYMVEELVGILLKEIKNRADQYTGKEIEKVVLGRPVNFVGGNNKIAKERLIKAAKKAGFTDIKLQFEPIGAAYDFGVEINKQNIVMVFDFGGGTLDLSIVKFPEKEILINSGIPLGGDLINSKLFIKQFAKHFGKGEKYGINQMQMPETLYMQLQNWYAISLLKTQGFYDSIEHFSYLNSRPDSLENLKDLVKDNLGFKLYEEIDRVKKSLSDEHKVNFELQISNSLISDDLSRDSFEAMIKQDLDRIEELITKTIKEVGLKNEQIDNIALTGGSSLIPAVQSILAQRFGKEKLNYKDTFTSVASGLALYGEEVY